MIPPHEIEEMWLAEFLWRRFQGDELWEEAQERVEETRPRVFAASAAAGGGTGEVTLSVTGKDTSEYEPSTED